MDERKFIPIGIILLLIGITGVHLSLCWAFAPMAQGETNQLSDVAPRITHVLPLVAFGLFTLFSGVVLSVIGLVKAVRARLKR